MDRIAVFAKWPSVGRVKTRLSPALPANLACDLHRAMLEDARSAAAGSRAEERFQYWADARADDDTVPIPEGFVVRSQDGADLGARLESAFGELLATERDRAVVIGADCPDLDAAAVDAAFDVMNSSDVVLGPTVDGGYYLVGLRRPATRLFRGIAWSGERVLAETIERARIESLRVVMLAELGDIDTPADLVRWMSARITDAEPAGGATFEALRRMKLVPGSTPASPRSR